MIPGIDVSHHNGQIDWQRVAGTRVGFAYIRASDGVTCMDRLFAENWHNAHAASIRCGAYHFFRAAELATVQAAQFCQAVTQDFGFKQCCVRADDLPPVLDLEEKSLQQVESRHVVDGAIAWAHYVERLIERAPLLYTTPNTIALLGQEQAVRLQARFPQLWISHVCTETPRVPAPWMRALFWQHSWEGQIAGIGSHVDLNLFNGDDEAMQDLIELSKVLT